MIANSLEFKPTVFVGDYLKIVKHLLTDEYVELLKPKVIWIEYRDIPILDLGRFIRNQPQMSDQFFFMELPTLNTLNQLLRSSELFSLALHGFSSIIINVSQFCQLPHDTQLRLRELMREINVILIMEKLILPRAKIKLVEMDEGK